MGGAVTFDKEKEKKKEENVTKNSLVCNRMCVIECSRAVGIRQSVGECSSGYSLRKDFGI